MAGVSRLIEPPIALDAIAMERWNELSKAKPWGIAQRATLAAYCAAFSRWAAAEAWLAEEGHGPVITIRDDKGNIKQHGVAPQLTIAERSTKEMERLAKKLGLR